VSCVGTDTAGEKLDDVFSLTETG